MTTVSANHAREYAERMYDALAPMSIESIQSYIETARAVEARRAEIMATAPRGLHARIEYRTVSLERARTLYLTGLTAREAVNLAAPYGDMNLDEYAARQAYLWSLVAPHGDNLAAFDAAIAAQPGELAPVLPED